MLIINSGSTTCFRASRSAASSAIVVDLAKNVGRTSSPAVLFGRATTSPSCGLSPLPAPQQDVVSLNFDFICRDRLDRRHAERPPAPHVEPCAVTRTFDRS